MRLPRPEPGLVVCYNYLWRHERDHGADEGRKSRPCLVLSVERLADGRQRVLVCAITHAAPRPDAFVVEVPPRVARAIALDDDRHWIVLDEVNRFAWPGYDLRPAGKAQGGAYGFIPPLLFDRCRRAFLAAFDAARLRAVDRS
ncbi:MAG: type II toxin-antitoxin system PemK/MazF family toxin [Allosphingosinicella sp.]